MASRKTVLLTGATGNVGSGLVPRLRAAGVTVRALTHSEGKAQPLRDQGAQVVLGDLDRPETLDAAVAGVEEIYLVTWNGPTATQQVGNLIAAAQRAGRPHIVRQSGYGSPKSRIIQDHQACDALIEASGLPYTFIAPTFFMQNVMMAAETVASDGKIYMPFKSGKLGMIDIRDVVDVAAKVLTTDGHEGRRYTLTGPQSISFYDVAAALSAVLSRPVEYVDVPPDAAKQSMMGMGMQEWIADGFIELMEDFAENWADLVSPDVATVTGQAGRTIQQFAQDYAHVFSGRLVASR
jgi:uncharacterized protein YbjT (DUF2867 family)